MYTKQIGNVREIFEEDNLHVIISEQIWTDFTHYITDLARFLSVSQVGFGSK